MTNKPNSVTIDLQALTHNCSQVKMLIDRDVKIMGIVKSDAYGHGLAPVSRTLADNKIDCLGVAYLHEAIELRNEGIKTPVIILCGIRTRDDSCRVVEKGLTPVIFDLNAAEILNKESERRKKRTAIHLKIDTGMGRLGFSHEDAGYFIKKILAFKNLDIAGLTSHLSSADEKRGNFTDLQITRFARAIETGRSMGLDLPFNNLANSAGIMGHKNTHFDMVRPGIMLYGGLPSPEFISPVDLRPAMCFKCRVLQVRDLPDNTPVSYGRTYYTNGRRRTAILSAGYGEGLPRGISNRGKLLIRGKKTPIIGKVCMNLTICDITGINGVKPGDEAVFLGSQGNETITGDNIAGLVGTISYEVFCAIGHGNKKEYLS